MPKREKPRGKSPLITDEDRAMIRSRVASERGKKIWMNRKRLVKPQPSEVPVKWQAPIPKPFTRSINAEVQYGKLRPWMKSFAIWLMTQPVKPSKQDMMDRASMLAHGKVSGTMVLALRRRIDFKEFCQEVSADSVRMAKEQYEAVLPDMAAGTKIALDLAIQSRDPKAIMAVVQPAVDRFWPKKDEQAVGQAQQVVVQVNTGQAKSMADLPPEPEIEVIVNKSEQEIEE